MIWEEVRRKFESRDAVIVPPTTSTLLSSLAAAPSLVPVQVPSPINSAVLSLGALCRCEFVGNGQHANCACHSDVASSMVQTTHMFPQC